MYYHAERIFYARLLIKMHVTRPLPKSIKVCDPEGGVVDQTVVYDWKPMYCPVCCQIGHVCPTTKQKKYEQRDPPPATKQQKVWRAKRVLDPKVDAIDAQRRWLEQLCEEEKLSSLKSKIPVQVTDDEWIKSSGKSVARTLVNPPLVQIGSEVFEGSNYLPWVPRLVFSVHCDSFFLHPAGLQLRAENHPSFSENPRCQGVNNNNNEENSRVSNRNTKLVDGKIDEGTKNSSINNEEGTKLTDMQASRERNGLLVVDHNGVTGKRSMESNGKNEKVLNNSTYGCDKIWDACT
ncbi:hypothetical protein RND71_008353 [Anisodus tanguticus]|uniref:Uncharacterized protein n=1 Tax=Anisodus tanguticus TaxID=243964 RepID=A0AAE1VTQ9_9SOLA|nr:hypothetical protein RND71_008353 [Anisodus tanguticus]